MFSKTPYKDPVKTRLAKDIGLDLAHQVYDICIQNTLKNLSPLINDENDLIVSLFSENKSDYWNKIPTIIQPRSDDLGKRLIKSIEEIQSEYQQIVILGADSPEVPSSIFAQGISSRVSNEIIWGPAVDGGFYLAGFNSDINLKIFEEITYSSSQTLNMLVERAKKYNIESTFLTSFNDIDYKSDLLSSSLSGFESIKKQFLS